MHKDKKIEVLHQLIGAMESKDREAIATRKRPAPAPAAPAPKKKEDDSGEIDLAALRALYEKD